MCLSVLLNNKEKKEILDSIKKEGLKVYKIVNLRENKFHPISRHMDVPYDEGNNEANTVEILSVGGWGQKKYNSGFHFFKELIDAEKYLKTFDEIVKYHKMKYSTADYPNFKLIECMVKKSWITAIGKEALPILAINPLVKKSLFLSRSSNPYDQYTIIVTNQAIFPENNLESGSIK